MITHRESDNHIQETVRSRKAPARILLLDINDSMRYVPLS